MTATPDSTTEDPAEAAERLELALERIAALADRPAPPPSATTEIAGRLDSVIARLRAGLGPDAT
jgi:hypothetical protein